MTRPWTTEPDYKAWVDPDTNLDCMINRSWNGALCGYVGVTEGHRYYGTPAEDVHLCSAHWAVNYAALCNEEMGICHVPEPGRPAEVWWLGFDCAHATDLVPKFDELATMPGVPPRPLQPVYRDWAYVEGCVRGMARELAADV